MFSKDIESMNFNVYFNNIKAGDASLTLSEDAKEENYIINVQHFGTFPQRNHKIQRETRSTRVEARNTEQSCSPAVS